LDEDLLDELLGGGGTDGDEPDPEPAGPDGSPSPSSGGSATESPSSGVPTTEGTPDSVADAPPGGASSAARSSSSATDPYKARLLTVGGIGTGEAGKRSRATTDSGRRVGARPGTTGAIHLGETIRAAAAHQGRRNRTGAAIVLRDDDLRVAVREGRESNLILFCVDASGSMAARQRMTQVKTAVLSLLLDAYQRRDKVGLIVFGGSSAELILPPTHSTQIAARRLDDIPAGGRTPLAEGLAKAAEVLELERIRDPRRRPLLVVVTDGRATAGAHPLPRAQRAAAHVAATGVATVVVDCESGPFRMGLAADLAGRLGAEHVALGEVTAQALHEVSRQRTRNPAFVDRVA
jgi:magnesium chelatase subunit D